MEGFSMQQSFTGSELDSCWRTYCNGYKRSITLTN